MCCDVCDVWFRKTCVSMLSDEYSELNSGVSWYCLRCDSHNMDSFTCHSYEIPVRNSFSALSLIPDDDSVHRHAFVPPVTAAQPVLGNKPQLAQRHRLLHLTLVQYRTIHRIRLITRDVCKSRIHDRRDYRDFRLVP